MIAFFQRGGVLLPMQTTIARRVDYDGVGLHSGVLVHLSLLPAPVDTGLVFVRKDLAGEPHIPAAATHVTSTVRATTLEADGARVFTVEHLMSAFAAFGIDNCQIEMDAEEPPVADGSSLVFFSLLKQAGRASQEKERRELVIDRVYRIDDGERFLVAVPYDEGLRLSFTSLNEHALVGTQYRDCLLREDTYEKEIAPARTIAYEGEVEALKKAGLGLGGTLENVIVYNDERWLNELRFPDELVRHKILDLIGDLRLAGFVRGHILAVKSGHALNAQLAKAICASLA